MEAIAVGDSGGGEGEEEEGEEGEKEEGEEGEKVASTAATKQEAQVRCHVNILASFFNLTLYLLSTCLPSCCNGALKCCTKLLFKRVHLAYKSS